MKDAGIVLGCLNLFLVVTIAAREYTGWKLYHDLATVCLLCWPYVLLPATLYFGGTVPSLPCTVVVENDAQRIRTDKQVRENDHFMYLGDGEVWTENTGVPVKDMPYKPYPPPTQPQCKYNYYSSTQESIFQESSRRSGSSELRPFKDVSSLLRWKQ